MPTDLVTMNPKELARNACMQRIAERRQTQAEVADELGISLRQVERLYAAYKRSGAAGLVSKRRGRPSNRRLPAAQQEAVVAVVRASYADFGPTLAHEKLTERKVVVPSVEALRKWMSEGGVLVSANSCKSMAATTSGLKIAGLAARCWSTSTTRPAR